MQLPGNDAFEYFLVSPRIGSTSPINVAYYLGQYCKTYLPTEVTHPTVNLLRKWYHTALEQIVTDKAKLRKLTEAVDAHSAAVAARHYILKGPEDAWMTEPWAGLG